MPARGSERPYPIERRRDMGMAIAAAGLRDALHRRGLRMTPQRRLVLEVIEAARGHVTGKELLELCRERDPDTNPSTVYRTLDVLEELGYLSHSHSAQGREEYHVLPDAPHAHLQCRSCGRTWEMSADEAATVAAPINERFGFEADIGHLTIVGRCRDCAAKEAASPQ
jgi:Fur family transcriptional regulator, ferric uptake regulator